MYTSLVIEYSLNILLLIHTTYKHTIYLYKRPISILAKAQDFEVLGSSAIWSIKIINLHTGLDGTYIGHHSM